MSRSTICKHRPVHEIENKLYPDYDDGVYCDVPENVYRIERRSINIKINAGRSTFRKSALLAQLGRALSWYDKDRWFESSPGLLFP
jgi:hypothetical protein